MLPADGQFRATVDFPELQNLLFELSSLAQGTAIRALRQRQSEARGILNC